jgi:Schlafen, AlbA_2
MFDRNYGVANPATEIIAYLKANQPGCKQLRRRAVIYKVDNDKWLLRACVIEGVSAKREIKPETSRQYPARAVLFEDWLTFEQLEKAIAQLQDGRFTLGEYTLEANYNPLRWERVRQPLKNPYMQHPGYVWTSRFQNLYNSIQGELLAANLPYYPDLHEALMDWLPYPIYRQNIDQNSGEVVLLLPETRAYFEEARVHGNLVDLSIVGTGASTLPLAVTGAWWDKENIHHFSTRVANGHATIEIPAEAKRLDYVLMDTDGIVYDFQQETEYHHSGLGITHKRDNKNTLITLVIEACRNGEGPRVEFKPYIKPDNDKLQEVIQTVAAFANAGGGHIFLGISDGCEVAGINDFLGALIQTVPDESACKQYLGTLGGKIREELKGVVHLVFSQVAIDGRWVAIIEVAEAEEKPITTRREERVLFVRRGSTNAKARPEEWKTIINSARNDAFSSLR